MASGEDCDKYYLLEVEMLKTPSWNILNNIQAVVILTDSQARFIQSRVGVVPNNPAGMGKILSCEELSRGISNQQNQQVNKNFVSWLYELHGGNLWRDLLL